MDNPPDRRRDRGLPLEAHGGAMRTTRRITRRRSRIPWDEWIRALVLVRLGQELGSETPLARAVHDAIAALLGAIR
jgi:hypothetical protein